MSQNLDRWIHALLIVGLAELGADAVAASNCGVAQQRLLGEVASDVRDVLRECSRIEVRLQGRNVEDAIASFYLHRYGEVDTLLGKRTASDEGQGKD